MELRRGNRCPSCAFSFSLALCFKNKLNCVCSPKPLSVFLLVSRLQFFSVELLKIKFRKMIKTYDDSFAFFCFFFLWGII